MNREEAIEVLSQDLPCEHDTDLIEALKIAIRALEHPEENVVKIIPHGDTISRKDTLAKFDPVSDWSAYQIIKGMPSAEKTGYWICHEEQFNALGIAVKGGVKCSECGYITHNKLHMEIGCPYKYCPNCGTRMESEGNERDSD